MPRPIDGKAMRSIAVRLRSAFDLAIHVKTYFVLIKGSFYASLSTTFFVVKVFHRVPRYRIFKRYRN